MTNDRIQALAEKALTHMACLRFTLYGLAKSLGICEEDKDELLMALLYLKEENRVTVDFVITADEIPIVIWKAK